MQSVQIVCCLAAIEGCWTTFPIRTQIVYICERANSCKKNWALRSVSQHTQSAHVFVVSFIVLIILASNVRGRVPDITRVLVVNLANVSLSFHVSLRWEFLWRCDQHEFHPKIDQHVFMHLSKNGIVRRSSAFHLILIEQWHLFLNVQSYFQTQGCSTLFSEPPLCHRTQRDNITNDRLVNI